MPIPVIETLSRLMPGDQLATLPERLVGADIKRKQENIGEQTQWVWSIVGTDVEILCGNDETIEAIQYGPSFSGEVAGISIGMLGDQVEAVLGPAQRHYPMPHPNYVLLYDTPTFLRIELDRGTERVILILR